MTGHLLRQLKRDRWWWLTTIMIFVLMMAAIGWILVRDEEEADHIEVEDVFFIMNSQNNTTTSMDIDVFITNHGDDRLSDITVRAFAVETDSNLARDEAMVKLGSLDGGSTVEGNLTIELPNDDAYRVELLVFKDGKLAIRGSGTVNLKGSGSATEYKTTSPDKADDGMGAPSSESIADSGESLICFIGIAVIVILVVMALKRLSDERPKRPQERRREVPPHVNDRWQGYPPYYHPAWHGPPEGRPGPPGYPPEDYTPPEGRPAEEPPTKEGRDD
jgi:hypothetical protein